MDEFHHSIQSQLSVFYPLRGLTSHFIVFFNRYDNLIELQGSKDQERLSEEFIDYQTMSNAEIPSRIWKDALIETRDTEAYHRIDILWGFIGTMINEVTGKPRFKFLSRIAKLVLCLPHSNADEERVFSHVQLNKTPHRDSMDINCTLSSILTVKMATKEPCFKYEPSSQVLMASKKATMEYNQSHMKKD